MIIVCLGANSERGKGFPTTTKAIKKPSWGPMRKKRPITLCLIIQTIAPPNYMAFCFFGLRDRDLTIESDIFPQYVHDQIESSPCTKQKLHMNTSRKHLGIDVRSSLSASFDAGSGFSGRLRTKRWCARTHTHTLAVEHWTLPLCAVHADANANHNCACAERNAHALTHKTLYTCPRRAYITIRDGFPPLRVHIISTHTHTHTLNVSYRRAASIHDDVLAWGTLSGSAVLDVCCVFESFVWLICGACFFVGFWLNVFL